MEISRATLSQVSALLTSVLAEAPQSSGAMIGALGDADLCAFVAQIDDVGRQIDALRIHAAGEVDARSRVELGHDGLAFRWGHRRAEHLLEQLTRVSSREAAARIRMSRAVAPRRALDGTPLPPRFATVGRALQAGELPLDSAQEIIRCLSQAERSADPDMLAAAEEALVDSARREPAALVGIQARVWRDALDPDGAEPRDDELRARRGLNLGREVNGMTPISGSADPASAALLRSLFTEGSGPGRTPRFLDASHDDAGGGAVLGPESAVTADPRTRSQRQFDILMGVLTAGIRSSETPGSMRALTAVSVVVRAEDLTRGTGAAWLDDVLEPISGRHAATLACDAGYRPVIVGDRGEILHLGRTERLFSSPQRRALAIRDGGCVWPGCDAPPGWCHAHHVVEWRRGGLTDIDNGVLLCSAHHHMLHDSHFSMEMTEGRPYLIAPRSLDPDQKPRALGRSRVLMNTG